MFKLQKRRMRRPEGSPTWVPDGNWFDLTGIARSKEQSDEIMQALNAFNTSLNGGAEYRVISA